MMNPWDEMLDGATDSETFRLLALAEWMKDDPGDFLTKPHDGSYIPAGKRLTGGGPGAELLTYGELAERRKSRAH